MGLDRALGSAYRAGDRLVGLATIQSSAGSPQSRENVLAPGGIFPEV